MNFVSSIESKRDGHALTAAEIQTLVAEYTAGRAPDYQMAALLMAVFFRGLDRAETRAWTLAMRDSGETLRFPEDPRPLADKHSTGGVGDKVSLPLAPLLACLGLRVPMISGRGLGITGGTLDKLESIPGFSTELSPGRIVDQVQRVGCAICGQTDRMTPADRAIYALRDVTGTVGCIPLIVASILSKKLAENLQALVLDVKFGAAAVLPQRERARDLARAMVALGGECGLKVRALLTRMDAPLGRAAGNWLEVRESVDCLEGRGPDDLRLLVLELAAQLLTLTGLEREFEAARARARACLDSGLPRRKWDELLAAQGADLAAFASMLGRDTLAPGLAECRAVRGGWIAGCDARAVGELARDLGGGRLTKNAVIDPRVGVDALAKVGEHVEPGALLGRVHARDSAAARAGADRLRTAFQIADAPAAAPDLVAEVID